MSKLANLPSPEQVKARGQRERRGPAGACDIYGEGDLDDWARVERLRLETSWAQAQDEVDALLVEEPIDGDKFRYHWRRKCWHWTEQQRRVLLEDIA